MIQKRERIKKRDLDIFFSRWLSSGLSAAELSEWKQLMADDAKLREEFCDWIKALRVPRPVLLKKQQGERS